MADSWLKAAIDAGGAMGLILFVVLCLACETGFRIGRWRGARFERDAADGASVSAVTGGMLALLSFVLGLTVSFAQARYEARRDLVATEANAISTAWLRARLVGGPEGEAMTGLIVRYGEARLAFTVAEKSGPIDALNARTGRIGEEIWGQATLLARRAPTAITAGLINALNAMFDASLSQRHAFAGGLPPGVFTLLIGGAVLAIGAMGYQLGLAGRRKFVLSGLLLVMWVGAMVITIDLNRPRLGNVRVNAAPLLWVIGDMAEATRAPAAVSPDSP